jgi:hypothetical protein
VPVLPKDRALALSMEVELAGSSAAGTPPPWGVLARGCGLSETIVSSTSVTYAPVSTGQESVSIYSNESGSQHKLLGARGNLKMMFNKDDTPYFGFDLVGRFALPSATALPAVTLTSWQEPLVVGNTNTPTFALHGYSGILESLSMDLGNKVVHKDRPGGEYVVQTDRIVTGAITMLAPAIGTKDFFSAMNSKTRSTLSLVHGTAAGNIATLSAPKVQITSIDYVDLDGERGLQMGLRFCRNSGDDEFSLAMT